MPAPKTCATCHGVWGCFCDPMAQLVEMQADAHALIAAGNRILASAGKLEAALRSQVDQQKAMSKLSASVDSFIADWMACQGGMK